MLSVSIGSFDGTCFDGFVCLQVPAEPAEAGEGHVRGQGPAGCVRPLPLGQGRVQQQRPLLHQVDLLPTYLV